MGLQETVQDYLDKKKKLNDIDQQIFNKFILMYRKYGPTIRIIKQNKLYFNHPQLGENVRTRKGPVVGYVDGFIFAYVDGFVYRINPGDDGIDQDSKTSLDSFLAENDAEFAYQGFLTLASYFESALSNVESSITKKQELLDALNS